MPRKAKAAATLPAVPFPNAQYGQGIASVEAQKAVPLPDLATRQAPGMPGTPPQPAQQPAPPSLDQLALAGAQGMPPATGMLAATNRPDEPVTAGLNAPGPVPVMPSPSPFFVELARLSNDPSLLRLAQRARLSS